jgi:hypothetical protein
MLLHYCVGLSAPFQTESAKTLDRAEEALQHVRTELEQTIEKYNQKKHAKTPLIVSLEATLTSFNEHFAFFRRWQDGADREFLPGFTKNDPSIIRTFFSRFKRLSRAVSGGLQSLLTVATLAANRVAGTCTRSAHVFQCAEQTKDHLHSHQKSLSNVFSNLIHKNTLPKTKLLQRFVTHLHIASVLIALGIRLAQLSFRETTEQ